MVWTISNKSNKSNESNEYERTRIKVRSFVANGYSLRIAPCSDDSFDIRPCSLIIYSNGLKFGRFVRCPSLVVTNLMVAILNVANSYTSCVTASTTYNATTLAIGLVSWIIIDTTTI